MDELVSDDDAEDDSNLDVINLDLTPRLVVAADIKDAQAGSGVGQDGVALKRLAFRNKWGQEE